MESRISIFHLLKDYSQVKRLLYMRLMPPSITVMDNQIRDFFYPDAMPLVNHHMLIVSSEQHYYGATSICYKGILECIAKEENSDLFIALPSMNASIVIPDDGTRSAEHVKWLFRGITDSGFLKEGEILSSMLYHFDRSTGIFETYELFKHKNRA